MAVHEVDSVHIPSHDAVHTAVHTAGNGAYAVHGCLRLQADISPAFPFRIQQIDMVFRRNIQVPILILSQACNHFIHADARILILLLYHLAHKEPLPGSIELRQKNLLFFPAGFPVCQEIVPLGIGQYLETVKALISQFNRKPARFFLFSQPSVVYVILVSDSIAVLPGLHFFHAGGDIIQLIPAEGKVNVLTVEFIRFCNVQIDKFRHIHRPLGAARTPCQGKEQSKQHAGQRQQPASEIVPAFPHIALSSLWPSGIRLYFILSSS